MNRDEKGRFTKGNKEGKKFSKRDGRATECAKKSNESQVGVKKFKEYLADNLSTEIKRPDGTTTTIKDYITFRLIEKAKRGDTRAIEMMLKLIDEYPTDKHDVNVTSPQGISIFCGNDEELAALHSQLKDKDK